MSNEMNEAYKKSIVILSEMMAGEQSPGSTAYKQQMSGGSLATKNRMARYRQLDRRSGKNQSAQKPGMRMAHTHPTPGPSLHEDYLRMAELMVEKRTAAMVAAGLSCFGGSCTSLPKGDTTERPAVVRQEKPKKFDPLTTTPEDYLKHHVDKRAEALRIRAKTAGARKTDRETEEVFGSKSLNKIKDAERTAEKATNVATDVLPTVLQGNPDLKKYFPKPKTSLGGDAPKTGPGTTGGSHGKDFRTDKTAPKTGPGTTGGSYGKDFRKGRSAAKTVRGKPLKSHTDAPEGPSLHEEYSDLVSILMQEASSKRAKRKRREAAKSDREKRTKRAYKYKEQYDKWRKGEPNTLATPEDLKRVNRDLELSGDEELKAMSRAGIHHFPSNYPR